MSLIQPPKPVDALPVELLFRFEALVGPSRLVPGAPYGARGVLAVTGGTFEGPRLRGVVVGGVGGEFATLRANGTMKADVRLLLETADGARIVMSYTGIATPSDGGNLEIRTAPLFETGDERYAWLNDVQAIAIGGAVDAAPADAPRVGYDVYRVF